MLAGESAELHALLSLYLPTCSACRAADGPEIRSSGAECRPRQASALRLCMRRMRTTQLPRRLNASRCLVDDPGSSTGRPQDGPPAATLRLVGPASSTPWCVARPTATPS